MYRVPDDLRTRPISRGAALEAGISARVLEGTQFRRVHEAVYCHRDLEPTFDDRVAAARLALPAGARTTGISRLQQLGLDHGPREPLQFVVAGDLHLTLEGVFLHRTVAMPPHDDEGVSAEAAFVAYCADARVIDAIKVGCMLLTQGLLDLGQLDDLLLGERWRRGVPETTWVSEHLTDRCRSFPEAEVLALMRFAGLPDPEVNKPVDVGEGREITPDFWWAAYRRAVEYQGGQHQTDRGQYTADIDRHTDYRSLDADYRQITRELLGTPRELVRRVHRLLVEGGYDGPPLEFGETWSVLFRPVRDVVPRRIPRGR